jgi:dTDP-4-amino-4,6-dideoxygalactose transaminase
LIDSGFPTIPHRPRADSDVGAAAGTDLAYRKEACRRAPLVARMGNMKNAKISVPMLDLAAQYRDHKQELDQAVARVIESQHFINGPEVAQLEAEIARYSGAKHGIGVTSGSDALLVGLMALGIEAGDEVITTPYTFFATVGAITRLGARPVFVDIDPVTFNIDAHAIEAAVTPRTKCIIPVHLFGQCADMDPILAVAKKHNLAVIEDAAQAIGSEYKGRRAGSMGTMGCFSFFPSKNLGCFGDGGAITTNDSALAEKLMLLRNHGAKPKYFHKVVGGNFRLDTLQAAVLLVKLKYLDSWTAKRQEHAAHYTKALTSSGSFAAVTPPKVVMSRHIFNQFVVRCTDRDGLREHLKQHQIGNEIYYPQPMHLQECFANLGHRVGDFPESELAALTTVAVPIYPELTVEQLDHVAQSLVSFGQDRQQTRKRAA